MIRVLAVLVALLVFVPTLAFADLISVTKQEYYIWAYASGNWFNPEGYLRKEFFVNEAWLSPTPFRAYGTVDWHTDEPAFFGMDPKGTAVFDSTMYGEVSSSSAKVYVSNYNTASSAYVTPMSYVYASMWFQPLVESMAAEVSIAIKSNYYEKERYDRTFAEIYDINLGKLLASFQPGVTTETFDFDLEHTYQMIVKSGFAGWTNSVASISLTSGHVDYSYTPFIWTPSVSTTPSNQTSSSTASSVPEPSTILLLGCGLIGLIGFKRKFRKN